MSDLRGVRAGRAGLAGLVLLSCVLAACTGRSSSGSLPRTAGPATGLHFAANANNGAGGAYLPGRLAFNLADVESRAELDALPAGVLGMAYLSGCGGADAALRAEVDAYAGDARLFGYYLQDEPDPATCAPATLAAESGYIHAHQPGRRTFLLVQNLSSSKTPSYVGGYNPANTGVDLFGIDPYPCRSELNGCDMPMIGTYVAAAERFGIPESAIVPVYQSFGGGAWIDDGGGHYLMPTAAQEVQMMSDWQRLVPHPVFDYAYSWGVQRNDLALGGADAALQQVFSQHNRGQQLS